MTKRLIVPIIADSSGFKRGLTESERAAQQFEGKIKGSASAVRSHLFLMAGALVGAGSVVAGLKASISAAEDLNISTRALNAQLRANKESISSARPMIDGLNASMTKLGFTNSQTEQAFTRLDRASGSAAAATKYMGVTADLAAAKHIDLSQAAFVLGKVMTGTTTILNRYGIAIPKGTSATDALRIAQQKLAGQAQAAVTPQKQFAAVLTNIEAVIGEALLPTVNHYLDVLTKWISKSENQRKVTDAVKVAVGYLKDALSILDVVLRTVHDAFQKLSDAVGGNRHALELLLGTFAAFKGAALLGSIAATATKLGLIGAAAAGAEGEVVALRIGLMSLGSAAVLGPIALAVAGFAALAYASKDHNAPTGFHYVPTGPRTPPKLVKDSPSTFGPSVTQAGGKVGYIARQAKRYGLDPSAVIGVASNEGLSGGIGDHGTSFGPFQLHVGGAFPSSQAGLSTAQKQAWAWSPAGIQYALRAMVKAGAGGLKGAAAVNAIVKGFERPANPAADLAAGYKAVGGGPLPGDAVAAAAADKAATAAEKKKAAAAKAAATAAYKSWKENYFTPLDNQYKSDLLITDESKRLNKLEALHAKLAIDLKSAKGKEHQDILNEELKVQGKIQAIQKKANDARVRLAVAAAAEVKKQFDRVLSLDVSHLLRDFDRAFARQMSAFDKATAAGLTGLGAPAQTPEEKALADFIAQRASQQAAAVKAQQQSDLAAAIASGDPQQIKAAQDAINQTLQDDQQQALQVAADASRVAADKKAADAQQAYQDARDLQKQGLQDINDDQRLALQNNLDDWTSWLDAKQKSYTDFLTWLRSQGLNTGGLVAPSGGGGGVPAAAAAGRLPGQVQGFASGGIVPGALGAPMLAVVHGGETVTPPGGGSGGSNVNVYVSGSVVTENQLVDAIQRGLNRQYRRGTGLLGTS